MSNETQIVGRCIGCMHDFSVDPVCGGCGAVDYPARQPAPVVGDEELALIFARAYWLEADAELPDELKDEAYTPQPPTLAGIRSVREALAGPVVDEAEFRRRFLAKLQASDDFREFSGGPFSGFFTGTTLAENIAIEIMREMSLAAQAVQVPDSEPFDMYGHLMAGTDAIHDDDTFNTWEACATLADELYRKHCAAIVQAKGGQE